MMNVETPKQSDVCYIQRNEQYKKNWKVVTATKNSKPITDAI